MRPSRFWVSSKKVACLQRVTLCVVKAQTSQKPWFPHMTALKRVHQLRADVLLGGDPQVALTECSARNLPDDRDCPYQ